MGLKVDFQDGEVFEGLDLVVVLVHHFAARGVVDEAEPAGSGLGDGVGECRRVPTVPAEAGRGQADHVAVMLPVVADLHDHADRLVVAVARADADAPDREGLFEFHVEMAGPAGIQRRQVARIVQEGEVLPPVGSDLGVQVAGVDAVARTGRIGEGGDVPVIPEPGGGLRERDADLRAALQGRFAVGKDLHGQLRRDPGPSGDGPSVAGVEGDPDAQAVGFPQGETPDIPPLRGQLVVGRLDEGLVRHPLDGELVRSSNAVGLHRLEVGGDAFAGEGAVHPVPVVPGTAVRGGILPTAFERLGLQCRPEE